MTAKLDACSAIQQSVGCNADEARRIYAAFRDLGFDVISRASASDDEIAKMYFEDGLNQKEIAAKVGVNPSRIQQKIVRWERRHTDDECFHAKVSRYRAMMKRRDSGDKIKFQTPGFGYEFELLIPSDVRADMIARGDWRAVPSPDSDDHQRGF